MPSVEAHRLLPLLGSLLLAVVMAVVAQEPPGGSTPGLLSPPLQPVSDLFEDDVPLQGPEDQEDPLGGRDTAGSQDTDVLMGSGGLFVNRFPLRPSYAHRGHPPVCGAPPCQGLSLMAFLAKSGQFSALLEALQATRLAYSLQVGLNKLYRKRPPQKNK